MSDRDRRELERAVRATPDDAAAWASYVRALDLAQATPPADLAERARRVRSCLEEPSRAFIDVGDLVLVLERETPYIVGPWRGVVRAVHFEPDPGTRGHALRFRVRPLALDDDVPEIAWRVSPRPEWIARGLELSPDDRLELIARAPSTPPPPAR